MSAPVPVTQADKNAVTAFHSSQLARIIAGDRTLGEDRDAIEQAFARHRRDATAELVEALEAVFREQDQGDGNAPGHGHSRVGIWDDDEGNRAVGRANLPCDWCAKWNAARAALARHRGEA